MKKISILEYETRFPKNNQTYFCNLSEEQKGIYMDLYYSYSKFLIQYFLEVLHLKEYDDFFVNSNSNYVPITEENMDIYQYLSSDYLKYIYIRNNIYIERLSKGEIEYLRSICKDEVMNDTIKSFIAKTYQKVIFESTDEKQVGKTNYGPESASHFASDKSIILGFRFDKYYQAEKNPNWEEENNNREMEIFITLGFIKSNIKHKYSIPVEIIEYNDYSIKKKTVSELENTKKH